MSANAAGASGVFADEPLRTGLQRMADEQLDLAIEQLSAGNGAGPPEAGDARDPQGAQAPAHDDEDARGGARRAGRRPGDGGPARTWRAQLSGARDAEVMLATLDALVERHPRKLERRGVRRLRAWLVEEREAARAADAR